MSFLDRFTIPSGFLLVLTTITAIWHLIMIAQLPTWLGIFIPQESIRAISLTFAVLLIFLTLNSRHSDNDEVQVGRIRLRWYDALLWLALAISCGFVVFFNDRLLDYGFFGSLDTLGVVLALCLVVPVFESVRRKTGFVLPFIILTFVAIAMFQSYLPGVLYGQGYSPKRLLYSAFVSNAGVFGMPLGIAVNIIIVFLIFGAVMERAGASRWFMDLALCLTGWSRGGPAKASVLSSAMFGSISGSPSANAATTGVFTIPMMKKVGYKPEFCAGVEAVASTGGMILPPVMGAIAFLMAEWIGRSYVQVVAAAAVPALLYFLIVFLSVHFEARRNGIHAIPKADLPDFWNTLKTGWYNAIPILAMICFLLVMALPPGMAGIYASFVAIACSFFSRDRSFWMLPRNIIFALHDAVMRWLVIVAITAAVGIMIGALELSGVGINISRFMVDLGGGNLLITLILVGIVSLIVGMGLDATPAYVTLATLMAPALVRLGVPDIAAHLYVIYWGLASFFTPPTCIAIFVTAPIAGASIWGSGWQAVRLGIAAFLVPIAFALNPALLMQGDLFEILQVTGTALLGAVLVAAGLRGFAFTMLNLPSRVMVAVGGALLIMPSLSAELTGLGLAVIGLALSSLPIPGLAPGSQEKKG